MWNFQGQAAARRRQVNCQQTLGYKKIHMKISAFYGILIQMFSNDHALPH